nr:MAG TPA: hypothetical protein [Caudoviricetes sp.]
MRPAPFLTGGETTCHPTGCTSTATSPRSPGRRA